MVILLSSPRSNFSTKSEKAIGTAERVSSYTRFTASDTERLTLPVLIVSQLGNWYCCSHCNRCYFPPFFDYVSEGRNYMAMSLLDLLRDIEGYSKETS